MSRRMRPAADPRFVQRYALDGGSPWPVHYAEAIADTLGNGLDVEVRLTWEDVAPWFRLRRYRGAVHVLGSDFRHLATMASIFAALLRGWERGGWGEGHFLLGNDGGGTGKRVAG